jgi:transcriptional regulator of arginine metabolism
MTTGAGKQTRQQLILELVRSRPIATQEDLRIALLERGCEVTQATLSRDLRELGLVRAATEDGPRYVLPESLGDESVPKLELLLPQLFAGIDGVSELAVLHTLASGAQPIAEAIDYEEWPEVLGTIAGENTVLLICRSREAREEIMGRVRKLAGR